MSQFHDRLYTDVPLPPWYTNPTYSPDSVVPLPFITGLTGGAATDLDGLITANGGMDDYVTVLLSYAGFGQTWQLTPSTDPEDGALKIRPDDYNSSTNARVWFLL